MVVDAAAVRLLDVQAPYAQPRAGPDFLSPVDLGQRTRVPASAHYAMARATCALCGQQAESEEAPLTWLTSVENGRKLLYCDRCARENVRSIEGKLDPVYW